MPVKKVHVKGKRKAPLPPTAPHLLPNSLKKPAKNDIENENINENCDKFDLSTSQNSINMKRKKSAPLPPLSVVSKTELSNNDLNNFSRFPEKTDEKIKNTSINLNIVEPMQIRNDLQFTCKQNTDLKRDRIIEPMNLTQPQQQQQQQQQHTETDQIWICNYCTLRNPFFKIVCDACERIKPYNTPTISMPSAFDRNFNKDQPQIDNINVSSPVKMRTKTINVNKDAENFFKRNSMKAENRAENPNIRLQSNERKIVNRPISVCYATNNKVFNTPEALEKEKDRIRAMIKTMNTRALAQKYPSNIEKPLNNTTTTMTTTENLSLLNSGAIKKCPNRNNKTEHVISNKYDIKKDYNFPSVGDFKTYDTYLLQTDDSKANLNFVNANANIDQTKVSNKDARANFFIQANSNNTSKPYDSKFNKNDATMDVGWTAQNTFASDGDNKLSLNLYVNFNRAVEVKVHYRMTLNEFKNFISKNVAPSKCPKIYFNGLLLENGEQRLVYYGIKDRSSLYINTENVVAHTRIDTTPIKSIYEKPKDAHTKTDEVNNKIQPIINDVMGNRMSLNDDNKKNSTEKYLIEHIQFDRFTVEKINPEHLNLSKTKYRGVYNYNPRCNPDFSQILNKKPEQTKLKMSTMPTNEPVKHDNTNLNKQSITACISDAVNQYMELLSLDDSMDLTRNIDVFECSICLIDQGKYDGVVLRNCLHTFCKDCVRNSIKYSDEAEVKCPYIDKDYSCQYYLQDREIKALLTTTEYDEHLAKSLRIAENQIENSFHCRTPNCKGWCIYEDDVNLFKCPICNLSNCLTCRVIHDGLNCKQYQTMMKNNVDGNPDNATTVRLLEEMVKNGEAMNCPTCRIVLMKKWGCDWLKCSMCKTEICWITRGPRWGPGGKGDTSAGCRCGVDGFRCHPKCTYCH